MKNILKYMCISALALSVGSCDSYFDVKLDQDIPADDAYESVDDVLHGTIGAYYTLGTYRFFGRNVVALGDMATDLTIASSSTGHFYSINVYSIADTDGQLTEIWNYGYKLVDKAVRNIQGANKIEADAVALRLSPDDLERLNSYKAQNYALRALATFTLTNVFGLPYQAGQTNSQLGVCLLDNAPLEPFTNINRSTVEECYQQILSDIANAKTYYSDYSPSELFNGSPQFYFNLAAIYALEARVNLFMGNYATAETAAQQAITLRASGDVSNTEYVTMWGSLAITAEDILTVTKTEDDNLSANALNTLYGSYRGTVSGTTRGKFESTDIRAQVLDYYAYKYQGIATAQAVSNIPIFRKSEMYLIIAECQAQMASGTVKACQEALAYTAKRNTAFVSEDGSFDYSKLPQTKAELLTFIQDERIRELYLEGHRWYDARRWGLLISTTNYQNFDVKKFVYPIPADEINAGFCSQQNDGWENALPD